jgi:putative sigma-54 modulation protein
MDIQITGKNIEVSQTVQDYIERKLGKLAHHLPAVNESKVEVRQERTKSQSDRFVVQVTMNSAGTLLRGESRAVNVLSAIDDVARVMARQAERFKGRLQQRGKGASLRRLSPPAQAPAIARVKRFPVQALTPEDAAEQMEMLGHSFFLFLNAETGGVNLVYRRQDGRYGLIEPVVA